MSALLDIGLAFFGFSLGLWWFGVTILPIGYGLPRGLVWAYQGWVRWRAAFYYLISPIAWNIGFFAAALALTFFAPSAAKYVRESAGFTLGSDFGILFGLGRAILSRSGRRDLQDDFVAFMRPHLTPSGAARFEETVER
ncbi:MAG: hypothetical protein WCF16_10595 [Alphaproteobacteria bacterium]